uniref:Uncharacterized protein n=1 Tax=Rhizophora mucronata TaxID=61149 RepID=A0A2P2IIR3_RHIMU
MKKKKKDPSIKTSHSIDWEFIPEIINISMYLY